VFYLLYSADLPVALHSITATYIAHNTAVLVTHNNHIEALMTTKRLFLHPKMAKKWRMKANRTKSIHVIFIIHEETRPLVTLNDFKILQTEDAKYLGLHLDCKLN